MSDATAQQLQEAYRVLGLPTSGAGKKETKDARDRLARERHPDRVGAALKEQATQNMQSINEAYSRIKTAGFPSGQHTALKRNLSAENSCTQVQKRPRNVPGGLHDSPKREGMHRQTASSPSRLKHTSRPAPVKQDWAPFFAIPNSGQPSDLATKNYYRQAIDKIRIDYGGMTKGAILNKLRDIGVDEYDLQIRRDSNTTKTALIVFATEIETRRLLQREGESVQDLDVKVRCLCHSDLAFEWADRGKEACINELAATSGQCRRAFANWHLWPLVNLVIKVKTQQAPPPMISPDVPTISDDELEEKHEPMPDEEPLIDDDDDPPSSLARRALPAPACVQVTSIKTGIESTRDVLPLFSEESERQLISAAYHPELQDNTCFGLPGPDKSPEQVTREYNVLK